MAEDPWHDDDFSGGLDTGLWLRILRHAKPYRKLLIAQATGGVVLSMIEVGKPLLTRSLIDRAVADGADASLAPLAVLYAVAVVLFSLIVCVFIHIAGRVATGVSYDLREKGFARLQELEFAYFDTRPIGWLVTRLTSDVSKIAGLIPWVTLDLAWGSATIVGIAAVMLWLSPPLALLVFLVVPGVVLASLYFQKKLLRASRAVRKTNSQLTAHFNEAITGVRTTKTLAREDQNLAEFQVDTRKMFSQSMRNAILSAVYLPLVTLLGSVAVGLALWRGGVVMASDLPGDLTLGTLVAFMQLATLLTMPVQELARNFTMIQGGQAAAERIQGLLDTDPKIVDSQDVLERIARQREKPDPALASDGLPDRVGTLEFRGVSFAYKPGEPVLSDFDLAVQPGQTVALVGATGGGKSTIVSLLARFYEPTAGQILVDETDYRDRSLAWWQSNLGVVLQTPHLFSGTIAENIRYGRLDATQQEVETAATLTGADAFIRGLADGYDTPVGEGGARLSTGQRQLVALARALLADPAVMILDEATSSVDTETERLIQDAVERVLEGRIAFVIAHRLSTIRSADIILVIEQGRLVELGSHDELLAQGGKYRELYTRQFADRALERGA
ncbi:MAG: ABC transporter ATP-binding protein [Planctomycetota bacterium]